MIIYHIIIDYFIIIFCFSGWGLVAGVCLYFGLFVLGVVFEIEGFWGGVVFELLGVGGVLGL